MRQTTGESRLGLIHRVIVPDTEYPREYAILVTDRRLLLIRQPKTRNAFWLRGEMRFGTALVTDVVPKTLEDYDRSSLDSLIADVNNISVPLDRVESLVMGAEQVKFRLRDVFVWLTMRRQKHRFQVYLFDLSYRDAENVQSKVRFYLVPLGAYVKPRRQTQSREIILREYAADAAEVFRRVIPDKILTAPS